MSLQVEMFKEAFIHALGMVVDLCGRHYSQFQSPAMSQEERIARYWQCVGDNLQVAIYSYHDKDNENNSSMSARNVQTRHSPVVNLRDSNRAKFGVCLS